MTRDNFAEKMRDRRLPFFLEIKIPDVAIDQRDHERSAQQNGGRGDMCTPIGVDTVNRQGGVECEREGEEL